MESLKAFQIIDYGLVAITSTLWRLNYKPNTIVKSKMATLGNNYPTQGSLWRHHVTLFGMTQNYQLWTGIPSNPDPWYIALVTKVRELLEDWRWRCEIFHSGFQHGFLFRVLFAQLMLCLSFCVLIPYQEENGTTSSSLVSINRMFANVTRKCTEK